jgi:acetyl-CoA C-acetyltransferase
MNQLCGSGLRAVALGMQQIMSGDANVVAAGGQESMSKAPHVAHLRDGVKMGDWSLVDTMIRDGLWDAFNGYHMGTTAENVARQWQITATAGRARRGLTQNSKSAAQAAGKFKDEIAPVTIAGRKGDVIVSDDEYIKKGVTLESVAKLKSAFMKDGTVTAANASGINDGAAVLIMSAKEATCDLSPVRIASWATAGVDPPSAGPTHSCLSSPAKAGWKAADLDRVKPAKPSLPRPVPSSRITGFPPR